jgi:uncharacterized protein
MNEDGLNTVLRFSRALGEKDFEKARSLLAHDLVVHEAGGLPYSGEYQGPQGFFDLYAAMNELLELQPGPMVRQSLDDDTIVSRFRLKFTSRATGESVEMNLVEIYRVSGRQINELDVYYKDPSAVTKLLGT